jgi:hypothetical protein
MVVVATMTLWLCSDRDKSGALQPPQGDSTVEILSTATRKEKGKTFLEFNQLAILVRVREGESRIEAIKRALIEEYKIAKQEHVQPFVGLKKQFLRTFSAQELAAVKSDKTRQIDLPSEVSTALSRAIGSKAQRASSLAWYHSDAA